MRVRFKNLVIVSFEDLQVGDTFMLSSSAGPGIWLKTEEREMVNAVNLINGEMFRYDRDNKVNPVHCNLLVEQQAVFDEK